MLIYNSTFCVDYSIEKEWVAWMKSNYLKKQMGTGIIVNYHFSKIVEEKNPSGVTYAVQYFFKNLASLQSYQNNHESNFRLLLHKKFPDQFVNFNTLLEVIDSL